MGNYSIKKENEKYVIYEGDSVLTTPGGKTVTTVYKPIADRILEDLNKSGYAFRSISSILSWHFTLIDNFSRMGHDSVVQILERCFLSRPDWTCIERHSAAWQRTFGDWDTRASQISQWFEKATLMQLTAACCIGNAYKSVNIAFELAKAMEKFSAGDEREARFRAIADMLCDTMQFGFRDDIYNDLKIFDLYYGIHLDENGPILEDILKDDDSSAEDNEDELNVDNLTDYNVTKEQLIGRNFYHYTVYKKDDSQPAAYSFPDLELDDTEDNKFEGYDDESDDDENEGLDEYLSDDCWVKRFVDDNDPNTCYLLYLVIDDEGNIEDSGCIEETSQRMVSGGGMFFMVPGMELPSAKSYSYNYYPPDKVMDDLQLLFRGRYLPLDFSFKGKRLPQQMIDGGCNGGSNTNYTYALQSAYRLAYMDISVDTTEEGIIEGFDYFSYQSSGSDYWDMFSRPVRYHDRRDEAMDMLLYIYDKYTDEELTEL